MHYKFLCNTKQYFCGHHDFVVERFKSLARQALTDPNVAIQAAGIPMPTGIPAGIPAFAENIDFTQSEVEEKPDVSQSSVARYSPLNVTNRTITAAFRIQGAKEVESCKDIGSCSQNVKVFFSKRRKVQSLR